MASKGLLILIPAYNESREIGGLLSRLREGGYDMLVIDDGSTDGTPEIAEKAGASVLRNEQNAGKGASLRRGFRYAVERGYEAVITMDADGQHCPDSVPDLVDAWEKGCDLVLGSREFDYDNMPFVRAITNKSMSVVLSWFCGQRLRDTQCGYRLLSARLLRRLFVDKEVVTSVHYDFESEVIIEASSHGLRITEATVPTIYNDSASSIRPFVDTLRFFALILKCIVRR